MIIGEICDRRVPTAAGTTTVLAAAKSIHSFDERLLVVTEERDGKPVAVGIVTARELVAVIAQEGNPWRLTLKDIMCPHPGFVTESDGALDTMCWMRRNRLRDVIVHSEGGALLGIVSMDELVASLADELGDTVSCAAEERPLPTRGALH